MIDRVVIINPKGEFVRYEAKLESNGVFKGYDTRHFATSSLSKSENTPVILVSQEEKKIKIFKHGKVVVQIDAFQKGVEKQVLEANKLLGNIRVGTFSTNGVSALVSTFGIAVVKEIILFRAPCYLFKRDIVR